MTSDLLDEDSYLVTDWAAVCLYAARNGKLEEFKKKLADYIYETNARAGIELDKYITRRVAEIDKQKADEEALMPSIRKRVRINRGEDV